jgi:hypothetical protein
MISDPWVKKHWIPELDPQHWNLIVLQNVKKQNIEFKNVELQNVELQNFELQNIKRYKW